MYEIPQGEIATRSGFVGPVPQIRKFQFTEEELRRIVFAACRMHCGQLGLASASSNSAPGSGYNAALLAHLVGDTGHVTTLGIDDDLVDGARTHLDAGGYRNVQAITHDGALGHADGPGHRRRGPGRVLDQPRTETWTGMTVRTMESPEWMELFVSCTLPAGLVRMHFPQTAKGGLLTEDPYPSSTAAVHKGTLQRGQP